MKSRLKKFFTTMTSGVPVSHKSKDSFFIIKPKNNQESLHQKILATTNINSLRDDLNKYPANELHAMLQEVDDQGKLPVDLVKECRLSYKVKNQLTNLIHFHMWEAMNSFPPISQKIDEASVLTENQSEFDPEFLKSLVKIGNETRDIIRFSSTHPYLNKADKTVALEVNHIVSIMRREFNKDPFIRENYSYSYLNNYAAISNYAAVIKKYFAGNCSEFAIMCKYICVESNYKFSCHVMHNTMGDHVVAVASENPLITENGIFLQEIDAAKLEKSMVLDAWSGTIYPMKKLFTHGSSYKSFYHDTQLNTSLNFVGTLNQHFHRNGMQLLSPVTSKQNKRQYTSPAERPTGICSYVLIVGMFASKQLKQNSQPSVLVHEKKMGAVR